jgi:hypothetical protein
MAASFFAVAVSRSFFGIAFFTFLLGVSSGLYVTAGYTLAVLIGSKKCATLATAAFESFGMVAGIVSPFVVSFFVLYLNWPVLFIALGAILSGITLLFWSRHEAARHLEQSLSDEALLSHIACSQARLGGRDLLREMIRPLGMLHDPFIRRFLIWSTLVGGLGAISWTGVNSFVPTYLVEQKGYSYEAANAMFALIAVSGLARNWASAGSLTVSAVSGSCSLPCF